MEEVVRFKQELLGKEYGSNIRKLAEFVTTIKDKEERTEKAKLLYKLVEKLHPSIKYSENGAQKIWEDLYIMSGEKLDIDVEINKPDIDKLTAKPKIVEYNQKQPRFKHYGRNVELLIEKLCKETDQEVIDSSKEGVGKLMKTFYRNWNEEGVGDGVIASQMDKLSDGKLKVTKEQLGGELNFDSQYVRKERTNQNPSNQNDNRNRNNNNNRNRSNTNSNSNRRPRK